MNRTQDYKRYMDKVKKERKIKIAKSIGRSHFCKIPGKLRKGKIHCSCSDCTPKTNTNGWKASDIRKRNSLEDKFKFFKKMR